MYNCWKQWPKQRPTSSGRQQDFRKRPLTVAMRFHPQQSNTNWADCACSSIPSDARQLGEGCSCHIYEAKKFIRDCQEPFKQELKAETLLGLPTSKATTQHWILAYVCTEFILSTIVVYGFCAFALLGCFFYFWKALLAIAVCFLVSWQVRTLVIQRDSGACYGSWFHESSHSRWFFRCG